MAKKRPYKMAEPAITKAQQTQILALADQFVRAGGGLVPALNDGIELSEFLGNALETWRPKSREAFEAGLEKAVPYEMPDDGHEQAWSAAWTLASASGEAGFLFGVAVGFQVASLTVAPADQPNTKKGGRR
jgi:hypothetical protein